LNSEDTAAVVPSPSNQEKHDEERTFRASPANNKDGLDRQSVWNAATGIFTGDLQQRLRDPKGANQGLFRESDQY